MKIHSIIDMLRYFILDQSRLTNDRPVDIAIPWASSMAVSFVHNLYWRLNNSKPKSNKTKNNEGSHEDPKASLDTHTRKQTI